MSAGFQSGCRGRHSGSVWRRSRKARRSRQDEMARIDRISILFPTVHDARSITASRHPAINPQQRRLTVIAISDPYHLRCWLSNFRIALDALAAG